MLTPPPPATAALVAAFAAGREPTNEETLASMVEVIGLVAGLASSFARIAAATETMAAAFDPVRVQTVDVEF